MWTQDNRKPITNKSYDVFAVLVRIIRKQGSKKCWKRNIERPKSKEQTNEWRKNKSWTRSYFRRVPSWWQDPNDGHTIPRKSCLSYRRWIPDCESTRWPKYNVKTAIDKPLQKSNWRNVAKPTVLRDERMFQSLITKGIAFIKANSIVTFR